MMATVAATAAETVFPQKQQQKHQPTQTSTPTSTSSRSSSSPTLSATPPINSQTITTGATLTTTESVGSIAASSLAVTSFNDNDLSTAKLDLGYASLATSNHVSQQEQLLGVQQATNNYVSQQQQQQQEQQQHLQNHNLNSINNLHTINNDDARALQLALELSMVTLNAEQKQQQQINMDTLTAISAAVAAVNSHHNQQQQQLQRKQQQHLLQQLTSSSPPIAAPASPPPQPPQLSSPPSSQALLQQQLLAVSPLNLGLMEERTKKSQNMTECVPVPSSEHVAEIVGRQGCKIKALRAKTNTYIKTPVRGEEPVFVVTGRKEDVAKAKREILSAAEHFSLIRAARNPRQSGATNNGTSGLDFNAIETDETSIVGVLDFSLGITNQQKTVHDNTAEQAQKQQQQQLQEHQITIQVRVPYRVVGLVVGPKGSTIKHIQQETQTYIVTPSREKLPIFEVTGSPDNVQLARKQIEAHIAMRTGNIPLTYNQNKLQQQQPTLTQSNGLQKYEADDEIFNDAQDLSRNSTAVVTTIATTSTTTTTNKTSATTAMHTINSLSQMLNAENLQPELLETLYRNAFDYGECGVNSNLTTDFLYDEQQPQQNQQQQQIQLRQQYMPTLQQTQKQKNINTALTNNLTRSCSSASSTASSKSAQNNYYNREPNGLMFGGSANAGNFRSEIVIGNSVQHQQQQQQQQIHHVWKHLGDSLDTDEGISEESTNMWQLQQQQQQQTQQQQPQQTQQQHQTSLRAIGTTSNNQMLHSPQASISPTDSLLFNGGDQQQQLLQQQKIYLRRDCLICGQQDASAALVPCGHNMFCLDCANRICASSEANCPICNLNVYNVMPIMV